jgi:hypothetical protein
LRGFEFWVLKIRFDSEEWGDGEYEALMEDDGESFHG